MSDTFCVNVMASRRNETLYVGVTNDLVWRAYQHKNDLIKGFTHRSIARICQCTIESIESVEAAIRREKQLKEWRRLWKLRLIEEANPD